MTTRLATALLVVVAVAVACGTSATPPSSVSVALTPVRPAGAQEITTAPSPMDGACGDPEASQRPGPLPTPGAMPAGTTMAEIQQRGRLIVGVDQNTFGFGSLNPTTGELEGFDIDLAREIARSIFGDRNKIDLQVVEAHEREPAIESGQVDMVVRTFSITCERKRTIAFSSTYFLARQSILARKDSTITSAADLAGKRVCAVTGTTSLARVFHLTPRPTVIGVTSWTDCLLMMQQAQADAISTDDVVLFGLERQDPTVHVVGASLGDEPYGVGMKKGRDDLVRFVNAVLARIRSDGTWERLYDTWLRDLGPSPGPPEPRYQD